MKSYLEAVLTENNQIYFCLYEDRYSEKMTNIYKMNWLRQTKRKRKIDTANFRSIDILNWYINC